MTSNIGITQEASRLAFRLGLELEQLLVERGLEAAARHGVPNVTPDQIESALDRSLVEKLVTTWKESVTNGERRTNQRDSGEAA